MNYTMDASYRTRAVRSLLKAFDVKNAQNPDPSFLKKMKEITAKSEAALDSKNTTANESVSNAAEPVCISAAEMTMAEYKEYIYDRISQLPMQPSNMQDCVSVQISEAGLEKMKTDPEYEQWVLSSIKTNFTSRDPWSGMCGGKYAVLYFGSEKEQSRGECWRAGYLNGSGNKLFEEKSKNSFWTRRIQRQKELTEQYEEMLELKELNKDLDQGLYYGDLAILAAFRPKPIQNVLSQH